MKKNTYFFLPFLLLLQVTFVAFGQECNLVANGDFASYGEAWRFNAKWPAFADYTTDLKGRAMIQVIRFDNRTPDAEFAMIFDRLYLEENQKYTIGFSHQASRDTFPVLVRLVDKKGKILYSKETVSSKNGMSNFTEEITANFPTQDSVQLELRLPTEKFKFYVDNVSLENVVCKAGQAKRATNHPFLLKSTVVTENKPAETAQSTAKAYLKKGYSNVEISGYARLELLYRHLDKRYTTGIGIEQLRQDALLVNGTYPDPSDKNRISGYREPLLMLEFNIKPIYNTAIKADFLIDNQMIGSVLQSGNDTLKNRRLQMYRYINLTAEHVKKWGTIRMNAGGVFFVNFTPLTFWAYEWRDDMFERYPWEWRTNAYEGYEAYYLSKSVARDARFANTNVAGIVLEGEKLPRKFGFKALFGKTGFVNNGFNPDPNNWNNYKYLQAFRISKNIAGSEIGLNFYNQVGYRTNNSLTVDDKNKDSETIITANGNWNSKRLSINAEIGMATFNSVSYTDTVPVNFPYTPISRVRIESNHIKNMNMFLLMYYVGNGYLNINSGMVNSSVFGTTNTDARYILGTTIPRAVTELGQMSSNRMSAVFAINPDFGKLKTSLGIGWSQETATDTLSQYISIQRRVASINRSRFMFYNANYGPYGNISNVWRRSWESFFITDQTIYKNRPQFVTVDLNLKYKTKILGKEIILTNYINYNNVTSGTGLSIWGDKNLLSYIFNDFTTFYKLNKTLTLVGQYCIERIETDGKRLGKGERNPNQENSNQIGESYGLGFDIMTGGNSSLYLRQKWYSQYDRNYTLDEFRGFESSAELKIFF